MGRLIVGWEEVYHKAELIAQQIVNIDKRDILRTVYGVPNGGIYAAQAVMRYLPARFSLCQKIGRADFIVDDIVDTGRTKEQYKNTAPHVPFFALYNKLEEPFDDWLDFPWELMQNKTGPQDNIVRILEYIGEDPKRDGLIETPKRVVKSYDELFSGYRTKPESVFKMFDDKCDEMVILKNVEFTSFCEHHMLPFHGRAHIGYVPNGKVVGVSKLARLLEVFCRRLQIQERIGQQITAALDENLHPVGSGCVLEAKHLCMTCRGIGKQHSSMVTSSLTGCLRTEPAARAEFFSMIRS